MKRAHHQEDSLPPHILPNVRTTMRVQFFSVRVTPQSVPIATLYSALDPAGPRYTGLEGGTGLNYLFCVNLTKDKILETCEKHGYEVNGLLYPSFTAVEVEAARYDPSYHAVPSYGGTASYALEKRVYLQ